MDRRETTRTAFNGVVQWKPSENFEIYLDSTYSRGLEKVSSMFMQLTATAGLIDYANSTVGADNTVDHLEVTSSAAFPMDLAFRNINGALEREQYNAILGSQWTTGAWTFGGRVNYARGEVQNDEKNSTATIFGVPRAIIDYTGGEGAPNFSFPGLDPTNGALVNQLAAVFNPRNNDQKETGANFNVEFKPEADWITSIKGGVEQRKLTMESLLFSRTVQLSSRTPTPTSTGATTFVAVPQSVIAGIIDANSGVNSVPFFDTGDLGFPIGIRYWNDNRDPTYEATIAASGLAVDPYGGVNTNPDTAGTFQNLLDTWSVEEKTLAGYLQAAFKFDNSLVPISALVGVRYFDTNTVSSGYNRVKVTGSEATFPTATREGGYNDWLPSLNLRFDFSDKFVGRVTAGDVMARPNPSQMAFRRTLDTAVSRTGSQGNPDLLPFQARQYDLGFEYYLSDLSYLSAGYFRTEIARFIINQTFQEDVNNDGLPFTITRPVNGTDKVTIDGFEVGGQFAFDFLPGAWKNFGIMANATFSNDKGFKGVNQLTQEILPFPGVSELSYNASLYYETEKFSLRTAYNWRESWLITASGRGNLPEFNDDYGTLDASASWNVTPHFTAFFDAVNLLDEQRIEYNNPFRRIGNETFGKRMFLGVRAKF